MEDSTLTVGDLPWDAIELVIGYLPLPSTALFAVAISAPSSSWCSGTFEQPTLLTTSALASRILSWRQLDFGDIETDLAERITDDDLAAVLICIDAKNLLQKLKLQGLMNVTGRGLRPLRGSTVIQQIDLDVSNQPLQEANLVPDVVQQR